MNNLFGDDYFRDLPLILAGPMLRHTAPEVVTVWLVLQRPAQVSLRVYDAGLDGQQVGACVLEGCRETVALGRSLHVALVTARSEGGDRLVNNRLYAYDIQFADGTTSDPLSLQQALCSVRFPQVSLSYFDHQLPTFALPPSSVDELRLVHGSCRKPHGHGYDALPVLDCLIEAAADQPQCRPHQLFLTGDQIYGDDVADPLLWLASGVGQELLGWAERLPVGRREPDDITYYTPQELPAGRRAEVATRQGGFTAGLRNKRAKVNSHLLGLGEYYAAYVLAWSPVCWPSTFPPGPLATGDRRTKKQWQREVHHMQQFSHTIWKVRRALANVPTYTICDDHDVSDDWNLNRAWCLRVLGRPLGRRTVQNALLAYSVFQAWGNTPQQFEAGQPGAQLLLAAQTWSASAGTDDTACGAIARYVGMPAIDPDTALPKFRQQGEVLLLDRDPAALTWHYRVSSPCHEVIVLDTRTRRGYPVDQAPIAPPMLLCPQAFEQQLQQHLQAESADGISARPTAPEITTFVIAPTNLFGIKALDWIHHWHLERRLVFSTDVGDSWNIHTAALAQFLTILLSQRQRVIVLSGDIHYSAGVRLSYRHGVADAAPNSVLIQLTASAMKNEELLTQILHTRLKQWLLPERTRYWMGWSHPPEMDEQPLAQIRQQRPHRKPDWLCALEWIPRQPLHDPPFGSAAPWLQPPSLQALSRNPWLDWLKFWRSRWFQAGREVVGRNNLAVARVTPTLTGDRYCVTQDLYWFATWAPAQIVYSRVESPWAANPELLDRL